MAARFTVRLTPRASREEVGTLQDGIVTVRVTAPPVDGAANTALVRLLAKRLGVRRGAVRIVSGATARTKVIEVDGLSGSDVAARLGGAHEAR